MTKDSLNHHSRQTQTVEIAPKAAPRASHATQEPAEACWVQSLKFDHEQIMGPWRFAVTSYLWKAHRDGLLRQSSLPEEFNDAILEQVQRDWDIYITRGISKTHFLKYAGRYIRRLSALLVFR
jgi:hypothetical protein